MNPPGRNDPCPCGSGRKYKQCCGRGTETPAGGPSGAAQPRDDVRPAATAALHDTDNEVVRRALALGRRRFSDEMDLVLDFLILPERYESDTQLTCGWLVYVAPIDGKPLAAHLLDYERGRTPERERAWIEASLSAPYSLWEVLSVEPERALVLRDLLTGEERRVVEKLATRVLRARLVLCGRVVDAGGLSLLCGVHPRTLGPVDADRVVRQLRRLWRTRAKRIPRARLLDWASGQVIGLWQGAVEALDRRPLPTLVNDDGDPLVWTEDVLRFGAADRDAVLGRLGALEGLEREDDPEGAETVFHVLGGAKPSHGLWDRSTVGRVAVGPDRLTTTSNSERRADALRRRVEDACGRLVSHEDRRAKDVQDMLASSIGRRAARPEPPPSAEMNAIARQMKERHYATWCDTPLPALGGLTPREATKKPAARAKVEVLLRDIELIEGAEPAEARFDATVLWRDLGLERP